MRELIASGEAKREPTAPSAGPQLHPGCQFCKGDVLLPACPFCGKTYEQFHQERDAEFRQRQTKGQLEHAGGKP